MPRPPWVFRCPACEFDHVKVYSARYGRAAYVVCGRCRALVVFDPMPRLHETIDLYNLYCDIIRSRLRTKPPLAAVPVSKQPLAPKQIIHSVPQANKEDRKVIFEVPLCDQHSFIVGEPIRGFQAEMIAQTRICIKCGHTERDQV